jgi:hydroxysqualene dehydroxylase
VRPTAVVVGAGFAGLAAAVELADRGHRVRVLERRRVAGGRAYSYRSPSGHEVDNGQHLMIGAYERTFAFLARLGTLDRIETQPRLEVPFVHPERGAATFSCPPLPSPLHLSTGVLRYRLLGPGERVRLLAGAVRLVTRHVRRDSSLARETVGEALAAAGQGRWQRTLFWDPLSIAVLNELPERASASLFAEVLRRIFFARERASRLVFPKAGLSALYVDAAGEIVARSGGGVECGRTARAVELDGEGIRGVRTSDGELVAAEAVVLAVPPPAALELLPETLRDRAPLSRIGELRAAPIVSTHLWYEERFDVPRMTGFLDGPIHWAFRPPMQPESGTYVTLVSSGAHDVVDREPKEIEALALTEVGRSLAPARGFRPRDVLVVKERRATWAGTPSEQPARPGAATPIASLVLAGDWTDTGLPGTIEGAVASGLAAAERIVRPLAS